MNFFEQTELSTAAAADLGLYSLPQLAPLGRWQLELLHDRPAHLLIWITRGQALARFDGARAGVGVHNAIFLPARHAFSFEAGGQCFGQALLIPATLDLPLPDQPQHLRIRDVAGQNELTGLLEALGREQTSGRPLRQAAMQAHAALIGIWMQRQIAAEPPAAKPGAARRLTRRYFARLARHHADGGAMAEHAAALGVTPTHLTRVCKSETGLTAASLLTQRVLHEARRRLAQEGGPARRIAADLGFGSAAYFTRFMQHHTGRTPSALRGTTS